jgi:hypothetical protein
VLKQLINMLPPATTFVTASTGVAAVNIGGITLHQFAVRLSQSPDFLQLHPLAKLSLTLMISAQGVGLGEGTKVELAYKVLEARGSVDRYKISLFSACVGTVEARSNGS